MSKNPSIPLLVVFAAIADLYSSMVFWVVGIFLVVLLYFVGVHEMAIVVGIVFYSATFLFVRFTGRYMIMSAAGVLERDAIRKKHPFLTAGIKYN